MKAWPVCPQCGVKRVAVCRFCKTEGDDFPLAEMEYIMPGADGPTQVPEDRVTLEAQSRQYITEHPLAPPDMQESPDDITIVKPLLVSTLGVAYASEIKLHTEYDTAPAAEPHDCAGHHGDACKKHYEMVKLHDPLDDPEHDGQLCPLMVMCPECGELITPRFLHTCRECDHEFPDGVSSRIRPHEEEAGNASRVVMAMVVMAALLGLMVMAMMASS